MSNSLTQSRTAGGSRFSYRPEIDGLRALAVIAVVLYHAKISFPGGYVGVDVFFVISGYLITSLILKDLENGEFSLIGFWERRVRRIFPALFAMVCATLALGWLMMPYDFESVGMAAVFQPVAAVNIYFWKTFGYFSGPQEIKPLLHTWSLAVEEQFYIFLPFLMLLLFRNPGLRKRGFMLAVLASCALISLGLAVYFMPTKPNSVFYLLPARAWEMLAGAMVAVIPAVAVPGYRWLRELLAAAGLAGIVIPCFLYHEHTAFPGLTALPPVIGAALFILANTPAADGTGRLTMMGRLFAIRPVVFIGLISYSLYLWHWPVLVFGKYWFAGQRLPLWATAALLAVMAAAAVLSWRYIETPFRLRKVAPGRAGIFKFGLAGSAFVMATGALVAGMSAFPGRFSAPVARNLEAAKDLPPIEPGTLFGHVAADSRPEVLLWGDSHAQCVSTALERIFKDDQVTAVFQHRREMGPMWVADYVRKQGISSVVICQYWSPRGIQEGHPYHTAMVEMIRELDRSGCKVWFLLDFPDVDADVPRALARAELFGWRDDSWKRTVEDHRKGNQMLYDLAASGLPATFLDLSEALLDDTGTRYRADDGGIALYFDDDHLTNRAVLRFILPYLKSAFAKHPLVSSP